VVLLPAETVCEVGVGEREKPHGVTVTGKVCMVPTHPAAEVSVTVTFTCGIEQLVNFLAALANEPEILATNEINVLGGNDKNKNVQVRLSLSGVVPKKLVPERKGALPF